MQADGFLRLAGPPEFTTVCVLPGLVDLIRSGLGLQVTLGRPAEKLLTGLQNDKFDLVVSTIRPDAATFAVADLFREEFALVAAPGVAAKVAGQSLQLLADLPLIAYAQDLPVIRGFWREVFGEEPGMVAAAVVPDLHGVLSLTVAGAGYTVLPRYLCRNELACGALVPLMEPATLPANTIFLARREPGKPIVAAACKALLESAPLW